jgi:hypothetical protein
MSARPAMLGSVRRRRQVRRRHVGAAERRACCPGFVPGCAGLRPCGPGVGFVCLGGAGPDRTSAGRVGWVRGHAAYHPSSVDAPMGGAASTWPPPCRLNAIVAPMRHRGATWPAQCRVHDNSGANATRPDGPLGSSLWRRRGFPVAAVPRLLPPRLALALEAAQEIAEAWEVDVHQPEEVRRRR